MRKAKRNRKAPKTIMNCADKTWEEKKKEIRGVKKEEIKDLQSVQRQRNTVQMVALQILDVLQWQWE